MRGGRTDPNSRTKSVQKECGCARLALAQVGPHSKFSPGSPSLRVLLLASLRARAFTKSRTIKGAVHVYVQLGSTPAAHLYRRALWQSCRRGHTCKRCHAGSRHVNSSWRRARACPRAARQWRPWRCGFGILFAQSLHFDCICLAASLCLNRVRFEHGASRRQLEELGAAVNDILKCRTTIEAFLDTRSDCFEAGSINLVELRNAQAKPGCGADPVEVGK